MSYVMVRCERLREDQEVMVQLENCQYRRGQTRVKPCLIVLSTVGQDWDIGIEKYSCVRKTTIWSTLVAVRIFLHSIIDPFYLRSANCFQH